MKKVLLFLALLLVTFQGWAAPVDAMAARSLAQDFLTGTSLSPNTVPTSGGSDLQLLHAEVSSVNVTMNAYYIYNTGDGFIIVAGDDRAEHILGYGDGEFDMNDIPCALQFMLDSYKEQIDYLLENPDLEVETPSMNAPMLTASSVSPLLTAKWGQGTPYNNQTPVYNSMYCKTGCSCVSLCQVMYYWKQPATAVPALPAYTTSTLHITVPALASTTFNWSNMINTYSNGYTSAQANAVATLMRYVGQAEEMDYTPDGSGAPVSGILSTAKLFGYDHNAQIIYKSDYTDAQWASKIQTELNASRPIVYAGWNNNYSTGHAFNIDGYNASNNKYHINWGWYGNYDGYFALNAFNPSTYQFNTNQQMIVDLKPQSPEIEVSPTSLSFSCYTGETRTATFNVKGYALTDNLTVKLNNGGTIYSINKTSITKSAATSGTTVQVTYTPTDGGSSNASVTISGGGAAAKTVSLSGTAIKPEITVSPKSLSFSTITGEVKTKTFKVTGTDLRGNLTLTLNNGGGIYSIDKTSITKSAATSGATVTVSYSPTELGSSSASVTISGGGAEPKTVNLKGTANEPYIMVAPQSLSFNTIVGQTGNKSFNVTGEVKGDLTLTLNDDSGYYTITKTSIAKGDLSGGSLVKVYFNPTIAGTSSASVTISGGGIVPVTVPLSGTAVAPTITVDPTELSFSAMTGQSVLRTFTITGANLIDNLRLTLSDTTGFFSIDKALITANEAAGGAQVTVTYNPATFGSHDASVTISGGGAETKTVALHGMNITPVITTNVSTVTIDPTYTGYEGSRKILVTGTNLTSNIELSFSHDHTNSFGLSKYTITPEEAAAGAWVTVYFYPMTGGRKLATLNIMSDGVETVSIPVSGTGIKSDGYITAWPLNLSFKSQDGTPVSQTFRVTYSYPNGSVMISSVGGNGETGLDDEGGNEGATSILNAIKDEQIQTRTIIPFDSIVSRRDEIIDFIGPFKPIIPFDPFEPILLKSLILDLTGDDCFDFTPSRIVFNTIPYSTYVTVTYHPDGEEDHDAILTISLLGGSARPCRVALHGTVNDESHKETNDVEGYDVPTINTELYGTANVLELSMNSKVYAYGQNIIIDSPVEQSAIISDVSGHAMTVNLKVGRNQIPVNASGVYVVRIREKTTKLMLK